MLTALAFVLAAHAGSLHGADDLILGKPLKNVSTASVVAAEHRVDIASVDFEGKTYTLKCKAPDKVADCVLKGPDGKNVATGLKLGGEDLYLGGDDIFLTAQGTAKAAYKDQSWNDASGAFSFKLPTTGLVDTDFVFGVISGEIK